MTFKQREACLKLGKLGKAPENRPFKKLYIFMSLYQKGYTDFMFQFDVKQRIPYKRFILFTQFKIQQEPHHEDS